MAVIKQLGRPRSSRIDDSVRSAVIAELVEYGYPGLTIEHVAQRARVAKTAIYRRWASKAELVFAVVVHDSAIEPVDHGSFVGDLRALAVTIIELLAAPVTRKALPGLLADVRADPVLAARFRDVLIGSERRVVQALLERARGRGDLRGSLDSADVHAHLLGAAFAWIYLIDEPIPADLADRIIAPLLTTTGK